MSFGHLHIHNEFSLLDGLGSANDYAAKAKELNQEYIALTNHGNIDGLLKFQRACQKQGIKPILGCEAYIVNALSVKEKGEKRNHVTLLIKNEKGFHNLCKLLTIANLEGFYYKPRIDIQTLMNHCEGLIVLSGCSVGILSMPDCQEIIVSLQKKLKSNFYLEVMPHEFKDQKAVNKLACSLSDKYNIPLVATNDCHYVHADDPESHEVLLAMQTQAKWADKSRFRFSTRGLFLCSEKQMRHRFLKQGVLSLKQIDEAIHSTEAIANKCDFTIAKQNIFLPAVPLYKDKDPYKLLLTMTRRKLQELIKEYALDDKEKKIYQARLSEEWKLIQSKGFVAYFCIVKELIDFCKANDIMVGAGRGSVGGSLVAFLLGITCVDPIKYNLLFSRFINEERQDLPDIDLDFEDNKREQVKEHLRELYGENNIASISTFLTMKGKAVVRDVARVFDVPLKEVDEFAKNISYYEEGDVIVAACKTDTGKGFAKKYPQVIKHAIKLEDTNKASGQHAAACIISADDLTKGTKGNLVLRKDQLVSNWDMEDSEHMGLMKLDVLGLNTLTVLHAFQKEILKNHNKEIDFIKLPLHSAKVYKQIAEGNNVGIFQISGWATNKLAPQIQADNIFGLSDLVALSRPGVSDSGMTDLYIERRQGNRWEKKHPVYEEITKHTYGIIVYQEQVMEMIYKIAGLPYAVADKIRKIIAKKRDIKEFQQYEDMFIEGCLKQGYFDKNEAMEFWETLQVFGGYLFNKCFAGDEIIDNGSGQRPSTIEEMFMIKNDREYAKKASRLSLHKKYKRNGYGTALSLYDDMRLRLNKIVDIRFAGKQRVYLITTTSGKTIRCSLRHKFPTPCGEKELGELKIGDHLYINGGYDKQYKQDNFYAKGKAPNNLPSKGEKGFRDNINGHSVIFKRKKERMIASRADCQECGRIFSRDCRFELHHKDADRSNNRNKNLIWLCNSCHKKKHYRELNRNGRYSKGLLVNTEKIRSIQFDSWQRTYDVEMANPYHNLVMSSGIIASNSHSIAYAITAYWTAWARCYYPVEYICALLNYGSDNEKNKKEYIDEARRLNLEIRMPSLAHSDPLKWKAKDGILYVPFIEIKGVGEKLIEKCIMPEVVQEPKGKGMTGFFQIKEKPKETTNKLKVILDKLTALEQEGNRSELQKYFSFNI